MADRIAQYLLGGLFLASGIFMVWFAANEGANLPGGQLSFFALAAFFLVIAWAILIPQGRVLALRLVGLAIFATLVWYVYVSLGTEDLGRAVGGLIALGLPAGYAAVTYREKEDEPVLFSSGERIPNQAADSIAE